MTKTRCIICEKVIDIGDWVLEIVLKDLAEHGFIHDSHLVSEHEDAARYLPRMVRAGQYGYPATWPEGT